MKTLYAVTGACGHLGNTIVRQLVNRGEAVRALALPGENPQSLDGLDIELVRGDVCEKESLIPFFSKEGYERILVIHCAGIVSVASGFDRKVVDVNVSGTKNIVELCKEKKVSRLVYVSSVHAIPERPEHEEITETEVFDPEKVVGLYAKTKAAATRLVLAAVSEGLDAVVVHPSGIIGPNDFGKGHLTQMVEDYANGKLTACIHGGYDFVDVRDVAKGVISAADRGRTGECYILSNKYFSITDLLNTISQICGLKKIKTVLPAWFAKMTAPLAETYYKIRHSSPLFTRYTLYTLFSNANFSHKKAEIELDYHPRDIRQTITDTVRFLKNQGRVHNKKLVIA